MNKNTKLARDIIRFILALIVFAAARILLKYGDDFIQNVTWAFIAMCIHTTIVMNLEIRKLKKNLKELHEHNQHSQEIKTWPRAAS